jgi:hypothetical protein
MKRQAKEQKSRGKNRPKGLSDSVAARNKIYSLPRGGPGWSLRGGADESCSGRPHALSGRCEENRTQLAWAPQLAARVAAALHGCVSGGSIRRSLA